MVAYPDNPIGSKITQPPEWSQLEPMTSCMGDEWAYHRA